MDRRILLLSGSFFALAIGPGLTRAYLPLYVESLGGTMTAFGFLGTVDAVCLVLLLPAFGYLTDTWGRRAVILLALGMEIAAATLLTCAPSWWWVMPAVILGALAPEMGRVPVSAAIADLTQAAGRGRAFGMFTALASLGGAVGPALAGLLLLAYHLRVAFALRLVLALVVLFVVARLRGLGRAAVAGDGEGSSDGTRGGAAPLWSPRAWAGLSLYLKPLAPLVIAEMQSTFGCGMFFPFLPIHLQRGWGLTDAAIGPAFTAIGLVSFLAALGAGYFADRVGRIKVLVVNGILCGSAGLVLMTCRGPVGLALGCLLWGLQLGSWGPALESLLGDVVPPAQRGRVRGFLASLSSLAFIPAPALGGALIDRYGFMPSLIAITAAGFIYAALVASLARRPAATAGTARDARA